MSSKALTVYENFKLELEKKASEIASQLPSNVKRDRFINSALAAVKQNPELLTATPRSLFAAIVRSAQDGLVPDGKEGVITTYRQKTKSGSFETVASWNPMVWGLRKRAKELDGIIINAQVVYQGDEFSREEGDDPKIVHKPATLGQSRGAMIGAYAIFKNDNGILHREVMDKDEIEAVRSQSKQQQGLLWTKFVTEAWRKTVVRRGIKSVPCSEKLEEIAHRDDELYQFDAKTVRALEAPVNPKSALPPPPVFTGPTGPTGQVLSTDPGPEIDASESAEAAAALTKAIDEVIAEDSENPAPPPPRPAPKVAKAPPPPPKPPVKPAVDQTVGEVLEDLDEDEDTDVPNPKTDPEGFKEWAAEFIEAIDTEPGLQMFWNEAIQPRKGIIDGGLINEIMSLVHDRGAAIRKKATKK